jgi:hypothetical protein
MMKSRVLSLLCFLCYLLFISPSPAAHVQFILTDFISGAVTNKGVRLTTLSTPLANGDNIVVTDQRRLNSGAEGTLTVSNMVQGTYRVEVLASIWQVTTFNILVPDTNIVLNAKDLITSTNPASASQAWTTAVSDARYVRKANSFTPGYVLTTDGTNWGASAATGGGDTVFTNELGVIHPVSSNAFSIYQNGSFQIGTNTTAIFAETVGQSYNGVFRAARDLSKGENDGVVIDLQVKDPGVATSILTVRSAISDGVAVDMDWAGAGGAHHWLLPFVDADGPIITGVWSNQLVLSYSARAGFGALLLLDNFQSGADFFLLQSNSTALFKVNGLGETTSTGVGSYSTITTNAIGVTGYTNATTINQTAYVTATAVAITIKNRTGATLYVSPTLTATLPVTLQPGWAITAASGLAGTVLPW